MTTLVLIRHGHSTANAAAILAGRLPGVGLDETGQKQACAVGQALAQVSLDAVYSSPMQRCLETARLAGCEPQVLPELNECDYGTWSGAKLAELRGEPLWQEIQTSPSTVIFPGGESMQAMHARVVAAVELLCARHPGQTVAAVSHGDPIKAILAHAYGMALDQFQRIHVSPAGISVINYAGFAPRVLCVNAGVPFGALTSGPLPFAAGGGSS